LRPSSPAGGSSAEKKKWNPKSIFFFFFSCKFFFSSTGNDNLPGLDPRGAAGDRRCCSSARHGGDPRLSGVHRRTDPRVERNPAQHGNAQRPVVAFFIINIKPNPQIKSNQKRQGEADKQSKKQKQKQKQQ
jgi:hypothetical protein